MENEDEQLLGILIGRDLAGVEFIRDYIQLFFDGPYFTAVNDPQVYVGEVGYERGQAGYCDALIACINHVVSAVSVAKEHAVRIVFDHGTTVVVSLRPEDHVWSEAAEFGDGEGHDITW